MVYIAPFANQQSNLFQRIPTADLLFPNHCNSKKMYIRFSTSAISYGTFFETETRAVSAYTIENQTANDLWLSTYIEEFTQSVDEETRSDKETTRDLCIEQLTESARVWYLTYEYIIIWSCTELQVKNTIHHDAALIYGIHIYDYPTNETMFDQMIVNFRFRAKSYFNDPLNDLVNFPDQMPEKCTEFDLFKCPKKTVPSALYIVIGVIIVVIFIILGFSKRICCSNKIYPL